MNILSQQIISENEEGDEDQELLVKTKPKTKRPPLYKVLLINDDYTPMEFVVMILERFFGLTHAQAFDIMITVHKKGLAVVGVFSYEVAETKVAQVMDCARQHQHPLPRLCKITFSSGPGVYTGSGRAPPFVVGFEKDFVTGVGFFSN